MMDLIRRIRGGSAMAVVGFAALTAAQLARAEDTPANPPAAGDDAQKSEKIEKVTVTGTLVRRPVSKGSQLVTTVGAKELESTGAGNAPQALAIVAQNQVAINSASSIGAGTGFASFANLRSLGSSNTLVLFNGKRIAVNPYQTLGVDLNTIPLAMIERVEVLSDGASSVYGSDAIAGVINFIPRREWQGLTASVSQFKPEHNGGERTLVSGGGGIGSLDEDGWNLYGGYSWHDKGVISMLDRDFAKTTYLPQYGFNRLQNASDPANWSQGPAQGGTVTQLQNPSAPGCKPPYSIYAGGFVGANACAYDFASQADLIPEQSDLQFFSRGSVRIADKHTLSLEYLWSETDLTSQISSLNVSGVVMSPANPFYPGNVSGPPSVPGQNTANNITLNWRVLDLGPAAVNPVTQTDRIVGQLDGAIADWDYEIWGLRSTSTVELNFVNGYVDFNRFRNGLTGAGGAPFLNPFGPQTAAGAQYLRDIAITGTMQRAETTLDQVGAQIGGDLFELPAGTVQAAFVAEYQEEETSFRNNPQLALAVGSGINTARDIDGARHSNSLTGEVVVPLLEHLEADLSVRYDKYSDFGETTNPKVLISYDPFEMLTLHGSYNEGFRAPTLHNLFSPLTVPVSRLRISDPVLCPGGVANVALGGTQARDCNPATHQILQGGNPDLQPERSSAYTLGFDLHPLRSLSVGLDYWNYTITDSIVPLSEAAIYANTAVYGSLIVRCDTADPVVASGVTNCVNPYSGPVAPIAYVVQTNQNLGNVETSGIDLKARWKSDEMSWGQITLAYNSTLVFDYDFQREPNGPFFSRAGRYQDGSPVIDYSHYASITWDQDPWTLQVANRYQAGYTDCNAECGITTAFFNDVEPYSLWDVIATFRGPWNTTLIGRVSNIFDEDPPFTNKTQGLSTGWDERFVDPVGRAYSITLRYDLEG